MQPAFKHWLNTAKANYKSTTHCFHVTNVHRGPKNMPWNGEVIIENKLACFYGPWCICLEITDNQFKCKYNGKKATKHLSQYMNTVEQHSN